MNPLNFKDYEEFKSKLGLEEKNAILILLEEIEKRECKLNQINQVIQEKRDKIISNNK